MNETAPNSHWDDLGVKLRSEDHYDGRRTLCFADRPPTIAAMFDELVARFPDAPAIVEDETLTYRELGRRVDCVAGNLAARGIGHGDRVALFLRNRWEFLTCVLSCARLGAIVVPIGIRQQRAELVFMLNDSGAKLLVFESDLADVVPSRDDVPELATRFSVGGIARDGLSFSDLLAESSVQATAANVREEDVAILLYTSGTTGRPKGAKLTHLGIIHSALTYARCLSLDSGDRGLVAVPLSHVTGLVGVAFSALIVGGCVVLMRQAYKTPDFLALASRQRITFSILVPTIYTLCVMSSELASYDLSAWRVGCFGGAPMPIATIEMLAQKLPRLQLINVYGATETTSPSTIMPLQHWRDHLDSVGVPVPCGRIIVSDDEGNEVPRGSLGELLIAGPMVVPGYWRRPDADAKEFVRGFWRSGDVGTMDEQGYVRVFDRKKDMINRGGFKVYSAEVENVVAGIEGVAECAVIGRSDPVLGERVHAVVVVKEGSSIASEHIRHACSQQLSDYKVPETVTLQTAPLPRNANGKVLKADLRAIAFGA
jgi:long-chain acyl-CoA synthetase